MTRQTTTVEQGEQWGKRQFVQAVGGIGLALVVAAGIGAWQVRGRESEAARPTAVTAIEQGLSTRGDNNGVDASARETFTVYLVAAADDVAPVQATITAGNRILEHLARP